MTERDLDTLELLCDAARHQADDPSADLMQRVLDDALTEQRRQGVSVSGGVARSVWIARNSGSSPFSRAIIALVRRLGL